MTAVVGRLVLLDECGRVAVVGLLDGGGIAGEVVRGKMLQWRSGQEEVEVVKRKEEGSADGGQEADISS